MLLSCLAAVTFHMESTSHLLNDIVQGGDIFFLTVWILWGMMMDCIDIINIGLYRYFVIGRELSQISHSCFYVVFS